MLLTNPVGLVLLCILVAVGGIRRWWHRLWARITGNEDVAARLEQERQQAHEMRIQRESHRHDEAMAGRAFPTFGQSVGAGIGRRLADGPLPYERRTPAGKWVWDRIAEWVDEDTARRRRNNERTAKGEWPWQRAGEWGRRRARQYWDEHNPWRDRSDEPLDGESWDNDDQPGDGDRRDDRPDSGHGGHGGPDTPGGENGPRICGNCGRDYGYGRNLFGLCPECRRPSWPPDPDPEPSGDDGQRPHYEPRPEPVHETAERLDRTGPTDPPELEPGWPDWEFPAAAESAIDAPHEDNEGDPMSGALATTTGRSGAAARATARHHPVAAQTRNTVTTQLAHVLGECEVQNINDFAAVAAAIAVGVRDALEMAQSDLVSQEVGGQGMSQLDQAINDVGDAAVALQQSNGHFQVQEDTIEEFAEAQRAQGIGRVGTFAKSTIR